jgi:hypothetical protein
MAENPSGPQASTAVGSSSTEGPLRARLPQAQAENILASLAGRSSASPVPVHNGHVPATPTGGPQGGAEPRAQAGPGATGLASGPGAATAGPQSPVGSARPQSPGGSAPPKPAGARAVGSADHAGPGSAAARPKGHDPKGGGTTGGDRGTDRAPGTARPTDPNSNDILPDLPKARFRFRLR